MCVLRIPAADFAHTHTDMIRINYRLVITTAIIIIIIIIAIVLCACTIKL